MHDGLNLSMDTVATNPLCLGKGSKKPRSKV